MRTLEKKLGTVDQLLIDNAIMGEVRDHHHMGPHYAEGISGYMNGLE